MGRRTRFKKKADHFEVVTKQEAERAILIGLILRNDTEEKVEEYLDELEFLAKTAGATTIERFTQKLDHPDKRTFVGSGKLQEIKEFVEREEITMIIFDDEISPSQQRNIEKELEILVLDRSMLILDIFATRAQTVQAKTQVELAQTQYLLPRLKGMWTHLDRVKGGIGMRGAGEKEIETDRRIAQKQISKLKGELEKIAKQGEQRRKNREEYIRLALVGYTNVGKSTIMNMLSKSEVLAENKLFATLDTTVRKIVLDRVPFLLSDTVGFIRKLPTHLIESFKSTLAESIESDIIVHVVDASHPQFEDHIKVVQETLKDLKVTDKPTLTVFNKMDAYKKEYFDELLTDEVKEELLNEFQNKWTQRSGGNAMFISALEQENVEEFREKLVDMVKTQYAIRYPYKTMFW